MTREPTRSAFIYSVPVIDSSVGPGVVDGEARSRPDGGVEFHVTVNGQEVEWFVYSTPKIGLQLYATKGADVPPEYQTIERT